VIRDQIVTLRINEGDLSVYAPKVYVTGSYYNEDTHASVPCYWKDGVRTELFIRYPGEVNGEARAITVSGGNVYVAGQWVDSKHESGKPIGCYWVNGERTDLSSFDGYWYGTESFAKDIAVSGGNVYVVGQHGNDAVLWVNGTRTYLDVPGITTGYAESVAVSGGNVYVAGWYHDGTGARLCYWVNGTRHDLTNLPAGSELNGGSFYRKAVSIAVSGSDVYVAGVYQNSSWQSRVYYWKNGTRYDLPYADGGEGAAIAVSGADVYVLAAGRYSGLATSYLWKNGVSIPLQMDYDTDFDIGSGITTFEGSVYVTGWNIETCYWKDGVKVKLQDDASSALGITVAE
jgi:hypothetical protein